ncbi:MAG: 30S ribosomal protein S15 [candidate division TM6 bacterium GW2011_GWF2_28_16]|jgi:small subunit ribosomal protein S15|nr:MAG: 30S ribosomal protein S15 [candidate division TM6 bacterium GW2011_GWF2_28_16]
MLNKQVKQNVINKFAQSANDTGSSQVQVAIITERIEQISEHLKLNPKDNHSKLGLLKLVGKRKTLLNYLKRVNKNAYDQLVAKLKD